jgi:hypothetical protein
MTHALMQIVIPSYNRSVCPSAVYAASQNTPSLLGLAPQDDAACSSAMQPYAAVVLRQHGIAACVRGAQLGPDQGTIGAAASVANHTRRQNMTAESSAPVVWRLTVSQGSACMKRTHPARRHLRPPRPPQCGAAGPWTAPRIWPSACSESPGASPCLRHWIPSLSSQVPSRRTTDHGAQTTKSRCAYAAVRRPQPCAGSTPPFLNLRLRPNVDLSQRGDRDRGTRVFRGHTSTLNVPNRCLATNQVSWDVANHAKVNPA